MEKVNRKEIQEARIKGYFLDSAKSIIRGEGVAAVSARTVADAAGYSYATIYNYFKDIRNLIFACTDDFLLEVKEFVENKDYSDLDAKAKIIQKTKQYANYFVQYPGIFDLLFMEKVYNSVNPNSISDKLLNLFNALFADDMKEIRSKRKNEELAAAHFSLVHGDLLMYLSRRYPSDYSVFHKNLETKLYMIF